MNLETSATLLSQKRNHWEQLGADERLQLANLFLKAGEQKIEERESGDELCAYCFSAEELSSQSTSVLFHIAAMLYRFGVTHQEKRFLLLSLGKLIQIEESDPGFFESAFQGAHLWGNLLVALSTHLNDESFLSKAIIKLKKALFVLENDKESIHLLSEVYWDLAEAYVRLGRKSGEPSDLKQGIDYYIKAAELGASQFHFWIDFGEAYAFYGLQMSDVRFLKEAALHFKRVIVGSDGTKGVFDGPQSRAWFLHALLAKNIWEMTHEAADFDEADRIFQEAIVSHPEEAALLWLHWGELFLRAGWYNKDPFLMDKALEKFTSTKLNEFDPVTISGYLCEALSGLGMCLDDYRLILEAKNRLKPLLSEIKKNPEIQSAAGMVHFAIGTHFSDEAHLMVAHKHFEKAAQNDPQGVYHKYLQAEVMLAMGELKKSPSYLRKGIKTLERITKLREEVSLFWSDLGIALLKFYPHEKRVAFTLETAIEKFKIAMKKKGVLSDLKTVFHYGAALDLLGTKMKDRVLLQESLDILTFVLERMPQSLNCRYQLGLSSLHLGELTLNAEHFRLSIQYFESVLKFDPEDDACLCDLGLAYLTYSEIANEEGTHLKKMAEYALTKASRHGNADASFYLACLYSLTMQYEKSLEFIKRAMKFDSTLTLEELEEEEWLFNLLNTPEFALLKESTEGI